MSAAFTLEPQAPYGALVQATAPGQQLDVFDAAQIQGWVAQHRFVVFRGFGLFDKPHFARFAQQLGEPLQWAFGAINELVVKPDAKNYLYTPSTVPLHWDGAFVGKIPHLIFFQCLKAPGPADLGGTTFADTGRALARATSAQRARWQAATLRYRTEKIVHYGGTLTQPLVAPHPVSGEPTIRFAEPVRDLNPVTVEVLGAAPAEGEALIEELQAALYDPAVFATHRWQDGDLLLADNHALLHGREAFANPAARHIQRINLLHRPAAPSLARTLKLNKTLRRTEFLIAEIPIFLIPLLLAAPDLGFLTTATFWLGLLTMYLLFNFGDLVNCYADRELDAIYKSHLANAVFELGPRHVWRQIVLTGGAVVVLCGVLTWLTGRWQFLPLGLIGLALGAQYSLGPVHFKSRGPWQLACLWAIIFFGPMIFTASLVTDWPSPAIFGLSAAYGLLQMGIILLNTAEDYPEDRAAGLRTIIIWAGLHRSMALAWSLILAAGLTVLALFAWLFQAAELPTLAYAALLPLVGALVYVLTDFGHIRSKIAPLAPDPASTVLKENGMKVPRWLKATAYTSLLAAAVLFGVRVLVAGAFGDLQL